MNAPHQPSDVVEAIEAFAVKDGDVEDVDFTCYEAFLTLTQAEIEKLAIAIMLDQEREVRRLAHGSNNVDAVPNVARFVDNTVSAISVGFLRFDAFGRLTFASWVKPAPCEVGLNMSLDFFRQRNLPIITNIVRRTLPWLLSREMSQVELPL